MEAEVQIGVHSDKEVADYIIRELEKLKCHRIESNYVMRDFYRYGIKRIKPRKPGSKKPEVGLVFHGRDGYKAIGWLSFIEEDAKFRGMNDGEEDQPHILIVNEHGHPVYWPEHVRRTKNFAYNFIMVMRKAIERAANRPLCDKADKASRPGCRSNMHMIETRTGGYFWGCVNDAYHGGRRNCPTKSIDLGFSPDVKAYAIKKRSMRQHDRKDPRRKTPRSKRAFGNRKAAFTKTHQPAY